MIKRFLLHLKDLFAYKRSYSQDGEDVALAAFYDTMKGYKGYFVDIGAHHPVRFSNTYHFYKKGWRGINVDAMPGSMKLFRYLRSKDVNLEFGVGRQSGSMKFFCFNEPALNSFDEALSQERHEANDRYKITKVVQVPIKTLKEILDSHLPKGQVIDFLSVDVEGLDLDVLMSNDWEKYRPKFLLIEALSYTIDESNDSELIRFLKEKSYYPCASLRRTIIFRAKS